VTPDPLPLSMQSVATDGTATLTAGAGSKPCQECGHPIRGPRANQKFCSDECRYANWAKVTRHNKTAPPKPVWFDSAEAAAAVLRPRSPIR
jgi:hypothetical protein